MGANCGRMLLCWLLLGGRLLAQSPPNVVGDWRIEGADATRSKWIGRLALQAEDGKLHGRIDWRVSGGDYDGAEGREFVRATFDAESRALKLVGERLEDAADLMLGEYSATLSAAGDTLEEGESPTGAKITWTAKRIAAEPPRKPVVVETGFVRKRLTRPDGSETRYFVFVPRDYDGTKRVPVVLFLHGTAEARGQSGGQPTEVGLGAYIRQHDKTFPYLVVFPQAQSADWAKNQDLALAALDKTEEEYRTDLRRVILTGLSMGGIGVWNFALSEPNRWAALVPICGRGDPKKADKLKQLPVWAFHGATDSTIPPAGSRDMVAALRAAGGEPRYTEIPKVGHACWDAAYATPELWDWLAEQRRP